MTLLNPSPVPVVGKKRPVTIVGAGFSGLTSAFYLSRAGFRVEVIEAQDRVGGLISTIRTPFGLVETAANALLNSARVEELFHFLNLELTPTLKTARKRFIFRKGFPRRWPLGIGSSLRLLRFLFLFLFTRKSVAPKARETVRNWATRVMGREACQYLVEPALQGVYAGDCSELSATLVVGGIFNRKKGEPKPSFRGSVCAPDGMGELMQRLRKSLEEHGVKFLTNQKFSPMELAPLHPHVIATACFDAAEIISKVDVVRAQALSKIEILPLVASTVCFREAPPQVKGFGCLYPPVEKQRGLGVLMNNFIFPHRVTKGFSETWIFGGARSRDDRLLEQSDQEIVNLAAEQRQATLNASGEILGSHITRWPKALPHYTIELERIVPELTGLRQNVVLIGNYLGQIGLTKILERAAQLPEEINSKGEWFARALSEETGR